MTAQRKSFSTLVDGVWEWWVEGDSFPRMRFHLANQTIETGGGAAPLTSFSSGGGGGSVTFAGLNDVSTSGQADGYIVYWDQAASKYKLEAPPVTGAPTSSHYITTTTDGVLSAETVFGTSVSIPPDTLANRAAASSTPVGALYMATDASGTPGQGAMYRSDGVSAWTRIAVDKGWVDALVAVETARATAAEGTNATEISTETSRAQTAEAIHSKSDITTVASADEVAIYQAAGGATKKATAAEIAAYVATQGVDLASVSDASGAPTSTDRVLGLLSGVAKLFSPQQLQTAIRPDVQVFAAGGTWTKPTTWTPTTVRVLTIGAGGAGGGGRRGATSSDRCPGAGGGAGGVSEQVFRASDLGATETVTIGAGGTAGTAATSDSTSGGNGGTGGTTSFGSHLSATGGTGGLGGTATSSNVVTIGGGTTNRVQTFITVFGLNIFGASYGGGPSTGGATNGQDGTCGLPGGGGNGGAISAANAAVASGAGGIGYPGAQAGGVAIGSGANTAGNPGTAGVGGKSGGGGSGGGRGSGTAGGAGGAGAAPGGGGGGGGGATNGFNSGAGGAGGDGYCIVVSW